MPKDVSPRRGGDSSQRSSSEGHDGPAGSMTREGFRMQDSRVARVPGTIPGRLTAHDLSRLLGSLTLQRGLSRVTGTAGRVSRRSPTINAVAATEPYSNSMIQLGTAHGRPSVRRCHTI